jgi:hypothetical protein
LTIKSNPPGALVYVNGLEVGRTPVTRDFVWYGIYDVELREDGYETLKTRGNVQAPWWQFVPIDFFAELMPFHLHDHQRLTFSMKLATTQAADPDRLIARAGELRAQLQSSALTRTPATTRATTQPKHSATTRSTTLPSTSPMPAQPSTRRLGF